MQRAIPILHIDSYEQAKDFYVSWLGFNIDWEFRFEPAFPVYRQISRDGLLLLHLSEHAGDNPGGVACHVEVDDLDALVHEWRSRRPTFSQPVTMTPWNAKQLAIADPFGNRLGINQLAPESSD